MVLFIQTPNSLQDLKRVFLAWRVDNHWIEPPRQGCILHDRVAVFILRRSPDNRNLASGQGGLQNVRHPF